MDGSTSRRYSVASTSSSSASTSSHLWDEASSPASSPATSYSASFCSSPSSARSPSGFTRRRANTGASITFDAVARMHTLDEQHEDITQANEAPVEAAEEDGRVATMELETEEQPLPPVRPKLTQRLFSKTKERASSVGRPSFLRPKLERREASAQTVADGTIPLPSPSPSLFKSKRFKQLRGRLAQSAPVSPAFSPAPSTDKVHLFHSRPTSVILSTTSNGTRASLCFPVTPFASPPLSSNKTSYFVPMVVELVSLDDNEANEVFVEAYPRNLFDGLLPREIRIKVFSKVVENSLQEHKATLSSGQWTAQRASSERWVGEAGGLRELIKLSRVCREWKDLAFDGQLWQTVNLARSLGNDTLRPEGLLRLSANAGSFLRKLDLRGFASLRSEHLEGIASGCTASAGITSLAYVDLTGCRAVSTKALHYLLTHSPDIETLKLRGLPAVVSSTCYIVIASAIQRLKVLDVSLCRNLLAAALLDLNQPSLEKLYSANIASMDDATLGSLPLTFPELQVLDVGYSKAVTDAAFAKWPVESEGGTRLTQLRLSGCSRLTDQTCWNLLGKVMSLECLELACIGVNLRDGGVIKLIESLPKLRKIDLEDATSLTDRVVSALTPAKHSKTRPLEHVNLTNLPDITEQALGRLVRACPKLRIAECSSSFNVSDAFVKAFTHHVKRNRILGAELNIVDCRGVGGQVFRDNSAFRPRRGMRDYASRHFEYIDKEPVRGKGVAECDDKRIVVHSYWTWQQLDEEEKAARTLRAAKLAIEGGAAPPRLGGSSAFTLGQARRASFGLRADGSSGSCIIA